MCDSSLFELDGNGLTFVFDPIKESEKSELPGDNMKLIHSGKVLKDDQTIESCGIKTNDFLVVMVTKPRKAAAAPAPAPASTATEASPPTPAAASMADASTATTPAAAPAPSAPPAAPSRPS